MFDELVLEYMRMRKQGIPVKDALRALHPYVEKLDKVSREELSRKVRAWENQKMDTDLQKVETKAMPEELTAMTQKAAEAELDPENWVECPNCSKKNRSEEYFCFKCGYLLGGFGDKFDTKHFSPATKELYAADFFGDESLLILTAKGVEGRMELRPQRFDREMIIGRSDSKSDIKPDVDLNDINGRELGVSRLHLALMYHSDRQVLEIYDLGSANGTRVNSQKLHPSEKRILRHGDELRLGRCVLYIAYAHPGLAL